MFTERSTLQSHVLTLVGLTLWLAAGASEVWEVLAVQPPDSPFHLGVLAGPVAQLRGHLVGMGTLCLGLAAIWPLLGLSKGWVLLGLFLLGALLESFALFFAAQRGMLAMQIFDPRGDARMALYGRTLGHALTWLACAGFLGSAVRHALRAREK